MELIHSTALYLLALTFNAFVLGSQHKPLCEICSGTGLPTGWETAHSPDGNKGKPSKSYYWKTETQETQWERPSGSCKACGFEIGDDVRGLWCGHWYDARIKVDNGDGTYCISWTGEGKSTPDQPVEKIRHIPTRAEELERRRGEEALLMKYKALQRYLEPFTKECNRLEEALSRAEAAVEFYETRDNDSGSPCEAQTDAETELGELYTKREAARKIRDRHEAAYLELRDNLPTVILELIRSFCLEQ